MGSMAAIASGNCCCCKQTLHLDSYCCGNLLTIFHLLSHLIHVELNEFNIILLLKSAVLWMNDWIIVDSTRVVSGALDHFSYVVYEEETHLIFWPLGCCRFIVGFRIMYKSIGILNSPLVCESVETMWRCRFVQFESTDPFFISFIWR